LLVGQDGILRADWQSAQACAGYQPARRLPTCPTSQTDPLPECRRNSMGPRFESGLLHQDYGAVAQR
jgi:hypothetical protein